MDSQILLAEWLLKHPHVILPKGRSIDGTHYFINAVFRLQQASLVSNKHWMPVCVIYLDRGLWYHHRQVSLGTMPATMLAHETGFERPLRSIPDR